MPHFTLHRNYTLRTTKGHSIAFVKGESTWVPPICVPDVVAIGGIPVEADISVIEDDAPKPVVAMVPEEREKKMLAAIDVMLQRNERTDFTASGLPHVKKLEELCGFEVSNRERDAVWQKLAAAKAEQE